MYAIFPTNLTPLNLIIQISFGIVIEIGIWNCKDYEAPLYAVLASFVLLLIPLRKTNLI
jgi:hypothetical protein